MERLFPLYIMLIPDIPSHKEESGWHSFLETTQGVIFTDELGDYGVHLSAVAILRHCMYVHVCYICRALSRIPLKKNLFSKSLTVEFYILNYILFGREPRFLTAEPSLQPSIIFLNDGLA